MTSATTYCAEHNQIFYMALGGDDSNDGSIDRPWKTLSNSISKLKPAQQLSIRGGTYTGQENTINDALFSVPSSESWDRPIIITGHPDERITIQHPDATEGIKLSSVEHHHIIIQDITIDGSLGHTANVSAIVVLEGNQHHIRFNRLEVKNSWYSGVNLYTTGGFNEFINCSLHHNGRKPDNEGMPGVSGDGIYIVSSDNLFDELYIFNNHGYGFYVNQDRNVLKNSHIYDNGGILGDGQVIGTTYGIDIGAGAYPSTNGTIIENCEVRGNHGGILVYTNSANTKIKNCKLLSQQHGAIDVQYIAGDVTIQDCTFTGNGVNAITDNGGHYSKIIESGNQYS